MLVALAATRTPSDLRVIGNVSMQRVLAHAAWVYFCQLASQWPFSPMSHGKWSCVEMLFCICLLAGDVLSAGHANELPPGNDGGGNDGWVVNVSVSQDSGSMHRAERHAPRELCEGVEATNGQKYTTTTALSNPLLLNRTPICATHSELVQRRQPPAAGWRASVHSY